MTNSSDISDRHQLPTSNIPINNIISQNENYASTTENNITQANLRIRNYQYIESDNSKINALRQDMSKYWKDTNEARNLANVIEKVISDKNYSVRLEPTLNKQGGFVNAQITRNGANTTITINPNSKNIGEFLLVHEMTHDIGTQDMIDLVKKHVQSIPNSEIAIKILLDNYDSNEIDSEILSDVSAQILGNQEFINSLKMDNTPQSKNFIKKVYESIKRILNNFTQEGRYKNFVQELESKWREAYKNQESKLNNNDNYFSIQQDKNGGRYVKVDTDQKIFEGIDKKDYNTIAKMYMQDYLEGTTKLSANEKVKIGNKGISKYTNPKQLTHYINEKMKLSTELKNVLEIAEKVDAGKPTKNTSKYPNWEYYKINFNINGKLFQGLINIGIDKNGNKHFYEINKIHTTSNSHVSASKFSSIDSINNSIAPSKDNVNATTKYSMQKNANNDLKNRQLDIIQKNNPMQDDYHTGIRKIEDIKTLEETLQTTDWSDYDEFNPDLTKQDIQETLKSGKITVYSSYSKTQVRNILGNVISSTVSFRDVLL